MITPRKAVQVASTIEVLAEREVRAESARGKADSEWRAAWWETTLALGAIPEHEKRKVVEAQAVVRDVTGQSVRWVQRRVQTGRVWGALGGALGGAEAVPPRMAVGVAEARIPVTQGLVQQMIQAEEDGVGLREFIASVTGQSWSDTPEGASVATIEAIVTAQPDRVAKAVARQPEARRAVRDAIDADNRERLARQGIDLDMPVEPISGEIDAEAIRISHRLDDTVKALVKLHQRCEGDQWLAVVARMDPYITDLLNALSSMEDTPERITQS